MRLGQWLANPNPIHSWPERPGWLGWLRRHGGGPTILRFLLERLLLDWLHKRVLSNSRSLKRCYYFVTDGGHHDNLGIGLLLERRCKLIIVSDVTQDAEYRFLEFLRVLRRARLETGTRIHAPHSDDEGEIDDSGLLHLFRLMRPVSQTHSQQGGTAPVEAAPTPERAYEVPHSAEHFFIARIRYPESKGLNDKGWIIYLKSTMTGDEPVDLYSYAVNNAEFPHDPTPDQFYTEDRFESYRQLGLHIGLELSLRLGEDKEKKSMSGSRFVLSRNCDLLLPNLEIRQRKRLKEIGVG